MAFRTGFDVSEMLTTVVVVSVIFCVERVVLIFVVVAVWVRLSSSPLVLVSVIL